MEYTKIQMEIDMKVISKMINSMDKVKKSWLMVSFMRENINLEIKMELVLKFGKINQNIMDHGRKICLMATANIIGLMAGNIQGTGGKINFMGKESIHGLMEENTQDHTLTTKNMVKVYINGLMVKKQLVVGKMDYYKEKQI